MAHNELFSVKGFAEYSRTTRDTLHHYDKIGLLSPMLRGENNYRYYSGGQLSIVNAIRILQESGMTLAEIKTMGDRRSPEHVYELFTNQIDEIGNRIDKWIRAQKLLYTLRKSINSVLTVDEQAITIQFLPAEAIILGELNDYSEGKDDYDALINFYNAINDRFPELDLNYPVWGIFSEERIKCGNWVWPDRYYFYNPEGYDKRPAAFYAIGYTRGGYGQCDKLYDRLIDYIDKHGYEICGNAYEEYPLNEICISDETNYLIRVMITVREKKRDKSAKGEKVFL